MSNLLGQAFTEEANLTAPTVDAIATKFRTRIGGIYAFVADFIVADHQHLYATERNPPLDALGRPLTPCPACGAPGAHWTPDHLHEGRLTPGRFDCKDTTR